MHRALTRSSAVLLLLVAASAARAAALSGNVFRLTGVWVGGGAGTGVASSTRSVVSIGQPVETGRQVTASTAIIPGFLQNIPVPPSNGGGVGGVDPAIDQTLQFTTPFGCFQVKVPAGCFGAPVILSVSTPSFVPPAASHVARLNGTPVALSLAVSPALSPKKSLAVTTCYPLSAVLGMEESRLRLAVLLPGDEFWLPLASSVDLGNHSVSAAAPRLGLWRVVEVLPADALGAVTAFPNPFQPDRGVMSFTNLPVGARLRLYTFSGRPVRELSVDDTGRAAWDGLNGGGETVSSGTYFVFIDGPGGRKTMKVQVQR